MSDKRFSDVVDCIKVIEKSFDFLRYDVIKRDFYIYSEKVKGCKKYAINTRDFNLFICMQFRKNHSITVANPFESIVYLLQRT